MYYELSVIDFKEENYKGLIDSLNENGIQCELNNNQGKNMFDQQTVDAVLTFSSNVAAGVLAGVILNAIGKAHTMYINRRKLKANSAEDVKKVIDDINKEL